MKRFPDAIPVQMRGICKGTERARARARAHERRDRRERASLTRGRERVPVTFLHHGHWPTGHGVGGVPYVEWPWPLIDQLSIVYCFFGWILIQEEEGVEEVSLAKFAITMTNVEQEGRIIRSFSLMAFFFLFFFPSD